MGALPGALRVLRPAHPGAADARGLRRVRRGQGHDELTRPSKGDGNEGAAASCGRTAAFDVDTGRKLWDKKLPGEGASVMSVNVTMTRGAVVAAAGDASVAYDTTSGKRFWADTKPSTCDAVGFAGGRDLLALVQCGNGADAEYRIQRIAPRSGEPVWTYKAAPGVQGVRIALSNG
ncbi:outer membrane protein assembly factor BamB family protein [Streptomyces alfalfae]